ncbi:MAG TPA: CDP-alcohol phosphatidyltransferase family protein [Candidatus Marinimicrobia bacterium]|nr:CDP-alcohol phosphatidyltransferase family protein [Candidatus Neomarinimicrobiota bacterium]HRS50807.1 CDP-alcohol phosphatidyltransferase family protein [Candidatus Neomarinimicrobiota bacterium]
MLKPLSIESWPDLFFYRPLAFGLVKTILPLPITPNMISFSAIAVGLCGGYCLALGTPRSCQIAGLLFMINVILDCSDGMLARYKHNGTPLGWIVDGLVDYCNGAAIFIGMTIGFSRSGSQFGFPLWVLIPLSLFSWISHSMAIDHIRREFKRNALGQHSSLTEDRQKFQEYHEQLNHLKSRWPEKLLAKLYRFYCGAQKPYATFSYTYPADRYYRYNKYVMRGWLLIDPSTHMTIVILSAILYNPLIFFWYTIIIANIIMLVMYPIQYLVNVKVGALTA